MSSSNYVLENLYRCGLIEREDMAKYETFDGQYKFEFKRESTQLWCTDTSNKFKCNIDIYNQITGNLLVHLNCSENDIMNILDCYTELGNYGQPGILCPPLTPYNSNGNFYIIGLDFFRTDPVMNILMDISSRWWLVKEYNPLNKELIDIVTIEMGMDELEEIMNIMYFTFLIDQEDKYGIVPMFPREDM